MIVVMKRGASQEQVDAFLPPPGVTKMIAILFCALNPVLPAQSLIGHWGLSRTSP